MTAPRPRRWFQIHLATCIVMMAAAGTMMYMNVINLRSTVYRRLPSLIGDYSDNFEQIDVKPALEISDTGFFRTRQFGWPFPALRIKDCVIAKDDHWVFEEGFTKLWGEKTIQPEYFVLDLAIAIVLITSCALTCEFLIRPREARKP